MSSYKPTSFLSRLAQEEPTTTARNRGNSDAALFIRSESPQANSTDSSPEPVVKGAIPIPQGRRQTSQDSGFSPSRPVPKKLAPREFYCETKHDLLVTPNGPSISTPSRRNSEQLKNTSGSPTTAASFARRWAGSLDATMGNPPLSSPPPGTSFKP